MSPETTSPTLAETAVAYYRTHGPEKKIPRIGLAAWRPVLIEMIEDNLTLDEVHTWMTEHHKAIHLQLPAKSTVRDWLTRVRQEIGKPLRRRVKSPSPQSAILSSQPEAPAAPTPSKSPKPEPPSFPKTPDPESGPRIAGVTSVNVRQKKLEPDARQKGEVDWTKAPATIPPPKNIKDNQYRSYWDRQFLARKKFLEEQKRRICEELPNGNIRNVFFREKAAEMPKTDVTASDYATRIADLNAIYRTLPDASMGDLWVNTMSKTYIGFVEG